jgi:hypothetical protein
MIPQKVHNQATQYPNNREWDKISNVCLKRMMIKMINEVKEDMYKMNLKKIQTNSYRISRRTQISC